jgi:hypothetical protein
MDAFGLSSQQLNYWKRKSKCVTSPLELCRKIYYNQLTEKEVEMIKKYLVNSMFLKWPVISVFHKMLRDGVAFMSQSTFYLYANLLDLAKLHKRKKKKKYTEGRRADKPLQILHMDVTEYPTSDKGKAYISFIVDNFSRAILGSIISLIKDSALSLANLKQVIAQYYNKKPEEEIELIVDGGSENRGLIEVYLKHSNLNIKKLVALVDIKTSNSMVEAINKIFKKYYLDNEHEYTYKELEKNVDYFKNDYTKQRPHGSLMGLIPNEVLEGAVPNRYIYSKQVKDAISKRIMQNLNMECNKCDKE